MMPTSHQAFSDYRDAIDRGPGFWVGPILDPKELETLRAIVFTQLLKRISELAPEHLGAFRDAGLAGYHNACHLIDHARVWTRAAREFPPEGVDYLEQSSFLAKLRTEFGAGTITNEGHGLGPEIVWRIVRPGESNDVQSFHADSWFWAINDLPFPGNGLCIKVWIILQGVPGKAGLLVEPNSHRNKEWNFDVVPSHDYKKPVFDEKKAGLSPVLLDTPPGHGVVFSYDLLHSGAPTEGDLSRVSFEFTLSVPGAQST